jgi:predicted PurR-regulated permease PerM
VLLLGSGPSLLERAIGALPPSHRPRAKALAGEFSTSLGAYLAGLSVIVVARAVATGMFLAIARVPFVIPLAMLAGLSVLVPYLGSVFRLVAIGAVAWAARGSGGALASLAFVAAYDVVENYVVSPIVYRKTLGISALAQLVVVLFLGYHFGVVGAVLAIPLAASAQILVRALRSAASDAAARSPSERRGAAVDAQKTPDAPAGGRSG